MFPLAKCPNREHNAVVMFGSRVNEQPDAPAGLGAKVFLSLFGLVFMSMGLLFVGLIVRDAISGMQTWRWQRTDCVISASGVATWNQGGRSAGGFHVDVKYHYTFGGQEFTSDRYERKGANFQDYGKAARLAQKYRTGSHAVCYVNPAAPAEAVLARSEFFLPRFFLYLLVFIPMIFVVVGGEIMYSAWRGNTGSQASARPECDLSRQSRQHQLRPPKSNFGVA